MMRPCRVCSSGVNDGIAIEEVDGGNDAIPGHNLSTLP